IPFIAASLLLFALGAAVAMYTFPQALRFLIGVGGDDIEAFFTPGKYLNLIVLMMAAFGIAFEFPVLLIFLQLARVITSRRLRSWRRPAAVVIVAVAAVITPSQDPYSLFAMAGPMYLFYEVAILIGRLLKR
ncbi:MAG: twin-arginine translocase subunit TatC, partial [Actinobacteria bacterium]|nr:twin-arginine translocase subunit TatC [Actinomycetota bacterium]